jgi:hypothetical protein
LTFPSDFTGVVLCTSEDALGIVMKGLNVGRCDRLDDLV